MSKFHWYVARCEQIPSGHWRVDPSVVLPNRTHLRYFNPPGRKDIALVRVCHADNAALNQINAGQSALKMQRIPLNANWNALKNNQEIKTFLDEVGVRQADIPNNETGSAVLDRIGLKLERFERKRPNDLPFLRDGVEE